MEAPSEEELIHNYLLDIKRKLGGVYLEESEGKHYLYVRDNLRHGTC